MSEQITCEECEKTISDKQVVFCEPCVAHYEEFWKGLLSEVLDALGIKPGHHIAEDVERAKSEAKKAKRLDAVIKIVESTAECTAYAIRTNAGPSIVNKWAEFFTAKILKIAKGESDE